MSNTEIVYIYTYIRNIIYNILYVKFVHLICEIFKEDYVKRQDKRKRDSLKKK